MTDLGDYQLDRTPGAGGPGPERWRIAVIGVTIVLIGAMVAYYLTRQSAEPAPPPSANMTGVPADEESVGATEELVEELDPIDLPILDASDTLVRELISTLSAHPTLAAWIATDDLVRTFVVAVDNMSEGDTPAQHLKVLAPRDPFRVGGGASRMVIDPRSYARYDLIVDAFDSLDVVGTAELYQQLEPLMDEAYRDLGYPDGTFDDAMARAIEYLVRTPVVDGEIALVSHTVAYEFADETLETLSPVQRQALRMGPRNLRLVKRKLLDLTRALGLPMPAAVTPGP